MNPFLKIITFPVRKVKQGVEKGVEKSMQAVIAGLIRHAITAIGGGLVTSGTLSDSDLQAVIGAVLTIFGVVWSIIQKRKDMPITNGRMIPLFLLLLVPFSIPIVAQIQFPITVQVVWDLNAATDLITKYTVTHNGNAQDVVPGVACTATECSRPITLLNAGPHVVAVTATNMWGTSAPTQITFTAQSPGKSGNVRIRLN